MIALNTDATFEGKMTCALKNDMWNLTNFYQSTLKCMSSKFTDLRVMTMKNDAKFEQKLTGQFKNDMRNLTIFDSIIQKSQ